MSEDDVYPGEMDAPHEFDDQAAEALLSGSGHAADPQLADLFDDMRVAYTSQPPAVGAELAAVLAVAEPAPQASPTRRFERMRSSIVARAGAATAAVLAATGGLAVAHALPASMQDAASDVGIGAPAHRGHDAHEAVEVQPEDSTTTTVEHASTTVPHHENDGAEPGDNHGAVGQHDANDDDQGENECDTEAQNEVEHDDEVTTTSVPCVPTTETTVAESHDGNDGNDNEHSTVTTVPEANNDRSGSSDSAGPGSGDGEHTTTPTTTSQSDGGDGSHSGSGDGSHSGSGDGG